MDNLERTRPNKIKIISFKSKKSSFFDPRTRPLRSNRSPSWLSEIRTSLDILGTNENFGPLNSYWQIVENSSRNFPEISVFRGVSHVAWHRPISGMLIQYFIELDRFLENSSIFEWVFKKSVYVMPWNPLNIIFRLNALFASIIAFQRHWFFQS